MSENATENLVTVYNPSDSITPSPYVPPKVNANTLKGARRLLAWIMRTYLSVPAGNAQELEKLRGAAYIASQLTGILKVEREFSIADRLTVLEEKAAKLARSGGVK